MDTAQKMKFSINGKLHFLCIGTEQKPDISYVYAKWVCRKGKEDFKAIAIIEFELFRNFAPFSPSKLAFDTTV